MPSILCLKSRSCRLVLASIAIAGFSALNPASAAVFPDKPIRIVVPYAPGGTGDVIARLVGLRLAASLGQQAIIDNRPGGAGVIGATAVARSAPDGYTLLLGYTSEMVITPSLVKYVPYATEKDFVPVAFAGSTPLLLVATPNIAARTFPELIALAKTRPLSYASAGNGSPAHIASAMLAKAMGVEMLHVPYKGGAQAVTDVLAGNVDLYFSGIPPAIPHVKAGKLTAIGVASKRPSPALPGVFPIATKLPQLDLSGWFGFFAPQGTPKAIVETLHQHIATALGSKDIQARLLEQGVETQAMSSDAFGSFVRAEQKRYQAYLTELNITSE